MKAFGKVLLAVIFLPVTALTFIVSLLANLVRISDQ